MTKILSTVMAGCLVLALSGCTGRGTSPVVSPPIPMPPAVQQACAVLDWAGPLVVQFLNKGNATQQKLIADAELAISACAAGNATNAIVQVATALYDYFTSKGIRAPVGVRRPVA